MKYDEYALLELFLNAPKVLDKETEIYRYSYRDKVGHTFSLHISTYEDTAILTLKHEELINPIFDIALENVEKIEADKEKLIFIRSGEPFVQVYLRPGITLEFLKL